MEAFRHHLYICDQKKPEGAPSCTVNGSAEVIEAFRGEIVRQGQTWSSTPRGCGTPA
jgi:hypothetical protein